MGLTAEGNIVKVGWGLDGLQLASYIVLFYLAA